MKTLTAFGDVMQAERIIKTESSVLGIVEGREVFTFKGVRDFTQFTLADNAEWDLAEATIGQLDVRQTETEGALLALMDVTMGGF